MMRSHDPYDRLWTFADVKAMLETVTTLKDLEKLNDSVEERIWSDPQLLALTDDEESQWTALLRAKAVQLEG